MLLTLYRECRIRVKAQELTRGGFGIVSLDVWQRRLNGAEAYTSLWIADGGTFETAEAAEAAGVLLAKLAIDDGVT